MRIATCGTPFCLDLGGPNEAMLYNVAIRRCTFTNICQILIFMVSLPGVVRLLFLVYLCSYLRMFPSISFIITVTN